MLAFLASLIHDCSWWKVSRESSLVVTRDDGVAGDEDNRRCRLIHAAAVLITVLSPGAVPASDAGEDNVIRFNISRQRADQALIEFAEQADVTFIFPAGEARNVTANAVRGEFTPEEAIARLLQGTGLQPRFNASGAWTVKADDNSNRGDAMKPRGLLAAVIAALTGAGQANAQEPAGTELARTTLEEVVVTAQKRAQSVKDVPISITAKSGADLEAARISNALDLSFAVPSLSVAETGPGRQIISIRGIGSERGSSSLTGVYLDEMPVTGAQDGAIQSYVDVRTLDLERVEVLKGPQGTLFGEGAVGGVVRYITKDPVLDRFGGRLAPSIYRTSDGDWSEELVAIINIPLARDVFGVRVAGTYEDKSGWIDQPLSGKRNINDSELYNIRVKALWVPTQKLRIAGMINVHRNDGGGSNLVNQEPHGDSIFLQALGCNLPAQDCGTAQPQDFDRLAPTDFTDEYELYNATVTYDLGFAELLSSTARADSNSVQSLTQLLGELPSPPLEVLIRGYGLDATITSQDLRLTSSGAGPFNWTVGAAYKDAKLIKTFGEAGADVIGLFGPGLPPLGGILANSTPHGDSESWAAYADASYKLTGQLLIGGGLRYFYDERESFDELDPAGTFLSDQFDALTFRAYASYFLSDDVHLYVNVADGFRSGGFNIPGFVALGAPATYDPESVISYEAGVKAAFLSGRISFDAAVFYSEYEDMQDDTFEEDPFLQYTINGQAAELKGVEWALSWRATDHLALGISGDVTDSEITKVTLSSPYAVGDPINFTPDYKVTATATYDFNWAASTRGYVRVDFSRQGKSFFARRNAGVGLPVQGVAPEVDFLNISLGAEYGDWDFSVFGKNLTDERGIIRASATGLTAQARPRTIGMSVGRKF